MASASALRPLVPVVLEWIDATLARHAGAARTVASYGFPRLPLLFRPETLSTARVIEVDRVPFPPLSRLGLAQFAELEHGWFSGVTFRDTYFVLAAEAHSESLHCHELVHVVQWRLLGPERFLLEYAAGILAHGYAESPFEAMAYRLQRRYDEGAAPEDFEAHIARALEGGAE